MYSGIQGTVESRVQWNPGYSGFQGTVESRVQWNPRYSGIQGTVESRKSQRWYSLENTTKMFYSDQCMRFWKVLYRLFHGKALRFMQGVKSSGQILNKSTSRGQFDPQDTNINFAVPDIKTVNNYESCTIDIPKQIQPGLIEQAIQMKPKTDTYVLSVDGKKLAPGLTKDNGDIDLFGYGMEDSIQKLRLRLKTEKDVITSTRDDWSTMSPAEKCQKLQDIVLIISYRIKDLRLLFMKQKLALSKFHKEAGDD
ncbi:unnamed protein product [Mytilus coruscus]|uniref:Uncharacterized protein n=2 Tax=Mytilus coruscus TaxID=42192 RepID=A0A6J8CAN8_MYTCO|nr:unnamed protein product [Mytilus coruscus]